MAVFYLILPHIDKHRWEYQLPFFPIIALVVLEYYPQRDTEISMDIAFEEKREFRWLCFI
jgi:hypothetical protein